MLIPVFYLWFRATAGWVLRVLRHLPIQPDVHKYQKGEHDYPELPQVIVWCQLKGDSTGTTDFLLCDLCGLIESGYDMVIWENKPRLLMFKPLVCKFNGQWLAGITDPCICPLLRAGKKNPHILQREKYHKHHFGNAANKLIFELLRKFYSCCISQYKGFLPLLMK